MTKVKKHIEIVYSTSDGLTSMGPKIAKSIALSLKTLYTTVGISVINNLNDLQDVADKRPDLVFVGMKFIPLNPSLGIRDENKIWISGYLESLGIVCTGSAQGSYELEFDKALAKLQVGKLGLKTPRFFVIPSEDAGFYGTIPLNFPVFIKPTNLGGGKGIDDKSVVYDTGSMRSKVLQLANSFKADSLIEEYLSGREFSVAILKQDDSSLYDVMPLELIAPENEQGNRILTRAVKSADTESFVSIAEVEVRQQISEFALAVFGALGARDFGRIDIRMDGLGTPYFLEANLIPSLMEGYGNFPKACMLNENLGYKDMVLRIARLGLARSKQDENEVLGYIPVILPVVKGRPALI